MYSRLRERLAEATSLQLGWLAGLVLPALVYHLGLRGYRLYLKGTLLGPVELVDVFKSNLFFFLGLGAAGWALLGLVRGSVLGKLALVGLQVLAFVVSALDTAAHQFWVATGSVLDAYLVSYSMRDTEGLGEFFDAVVAPHLAPLAIYGAIVLVITLIGPWIAARLIDRRRTRPPPPSARTWRRHAATALVGSGLLWASILPAYTPQSTAFSRTATAHLAWTALGRSRALDRDVEPADYGATDATLAGTPDESKRRNVVFIILESTRARSTTVYNDDLETTPFLDSLANRSLVADDAYAVVPHTSKAMVPILCGIEPRLNMPIIESKEGAIPARCLPDLLGDVGYRSVLFQSATEQFEGWRQLVDNFGFRNFYSLEDMTTAGFERANYFGYEDNIMLEPSQNWLSSNGDSPFFATYLTLTPHHQYLAPKTYGRHDFADDDKLNRYLNAVHYVDQFTKRLFKQYRAAGEYEESIFVILGDHGEAFGEHGRKQHDNVIWQEGLRIPLLIHDPQTPEHRSIEQAVNQLDLLPTVTDMLGYEIERADYPGKSILQVESERPMHANCWYERCCMTRIHDGRKYIYHFGKRPDEFYNLRKDPREQNNIIATQRNIDRWREALLDWRYRINEMYRRHIDDKIDQYVSSSRPEVANRTDVRFGDMARLVGWELSESTARPGDEVELTLVFEALRNITAEWKLFVHGAGGEKMLNFDHTPVEGLYPLSDWKPGQYVRDVHTLRVPKDWSNDTLDVAVGLYRPKKGRAPVHGEVSTIGNRRAHVATIDVEPNLERNRRRARTRGSLRDSAPAKASLPNGSRALFGSWVELLGASLDVDQLEPGGRAKLVLWFRARKDVPQGWKLFVHGLSGSRMMNLDHVPAGGLLPVDTWKKGDVVRDVHTFQLPDDWPTGTFTLKAGLWKPGRGRAPIEGSVPVDSKSRAEILTVPVEKSE